MKSILFVCLGNICRSPLAEGIARARLDPVGSLGLHLDSAGTAAYHVGRPPDPRAVAVARARGVDIAGLRGRQVEAADFSRFELILAADRDNLAALERACPPGGTRPRLLLEACGHPPGSEVPDPYYGGLDDFERVFELLDGAMARLREGLPSLT